MGLAEHNLQVNDLVTYNDRNASGVVYRITMSVDPEPYTTKQAMRRNPRWAKHREKIAKTIYVNAVTGKELGIKEKKGYVRLKPVFDFFGSRAAVKPGLLGGTKVVWHTHLKDLKKVDIVRLGAKYLELGEFMRTLMAKEAGVIDVVG